jgi:hypothetical protein
MTTEEIFENARKNGYLIVPSGDGDANAQYYAHCKQQGIPYVEIYNYRKYAHVSCSFFTVPDCCGFSDPQGLYDYVKSKYTLKPERFLAFYPARMGFTVLKSQSEDLARELFSMAMEVVEEERRQKRRAAGRIGDNRATA